MADQLIGTDKNAVFQIGYFSLLNTNQSSAEMTYNMIGVSKVNDTSLMLDCVIIFEDGKNNPAK